MTALSHISEPAHLHSPMAATDRTGRHLELLTDTIAAVNSSLDLDVVVERIAAKVTSALEADACFVYLYDETDDVLALRATHDGRFGDPSHRPRMHLGEASPGRRRPRAVR